MTLKTTELLIITYFDLLPSLSTDFFATRKTGCTDLEPRRVVKACNTFLKLYFQKQKCLGGYFAAQLVSL